MLSRRFAPIDSNDTTDEGPLVIGYAMCFALMGVLSVQGYIYFSRFPNDRLGLKALVTIVLILESLITIFALHGFWVGVTDNGSDLSSIVASGVGERELSPNPLWSFMALSPLTGVVSSLTQGFFCWRIWAVRRTLAVPIVTMMVSLLQCALVTYGGVAWSLIPDLDVNNPMPFYIPVWLSGSLFCDLMITIYMTQFFLSTKSKFRSTTTMTNKFVKLTIETGLITTTAAAIELMLAIAFRVTLYHVALFYIISKLYANCLLATLNARLILGSSCEKSVAVWDYSPSSERSDPVAATGSGPGLKTIQIHKQVETQVEPEADRGGFPTQFLNLEDP